MKCEFFGCPNTEDVKEVTIGPGTCLKLCPSCTAAEFSMCDQGPETPGSPKMGPSTPGGPALHRSDCAQHNMPAYLNELCDCTLQLQSIPIE